MEKTKLQKIVEQKAEQIRGAIEQAIDEGANVRRYFANIVKIDNLCVQKDGNGRCAVVLYFDSEKIAKVFEPSKEDLAELADKKRKKLEEIEQQLKERANE